MYDLSTLVVDGVARVGASLFPADVTVDSLGANGCRFMLIATPDGGWVAGAWRANPTGADPIPMGVDACEIHAFTPRLIHLTLASGQVMQVKPSQGCACGSRLRMYNPFGAAVNLASIPSPRVA